MKFLDLSEAENFFLISGPCSIEDESMMLKTAEFIKEQTTKRNIFFVFKSSYKKANRTSIHSPSGVGMEKGLRILEKIKKEFEVPILTDVHCITEVKSVAEVADIIQIPAFLSRQTDLIVESARTGRIVNLKKGQFMAPEDIFNAAEKVTSTDNYKIVLTERGTSFGYHDLIVDFRSFAVMKQAGFPVVYDVTHSLQKPSLSMTSGGAPEFAPMMARAALATGKVDGLFIETHPYPEEAISDSASMLKLDLLPNLLDRCLKISKNCEKYNERY